MRRIIISLIFVVIFLSVLSIGQITPALRQITALCFNTPSVEIYSVTPYDHGIVVALGYTNFTYSSSNVYIYSSHLYVYFLNSTTKLSLYSSTIANISYVNAFVMNGKLYVIVDTLTSSSPMESYESYVYVFQGLRLINTYTANSAVGYLRVNNEPLYNLSALMSVSVSSHTFQPLLSLSINVTLMLNETNITLVNQVPVAAMQLPEGILIVSENLSASTFFSWHAIPFNFTMFSYDGKIIWSKDYYIYNPNAGGLLGAIVPIRSETLLIYEGFATVIGNQFFILNMTAPSSPPIIFYGVSASNTNTSTTPLIHLTNNDTVIGINLENGEVTTKVELLNATSNVALLNIGGKLYVTLIGNNEVTIEKYNGSGFTVVTKIPIKVKIKKITFPTPRGNFTINETITLTNYLYNFGNYFLIINPTLTGLNVTDIYSSGITQYMLNENMSNRYVINNNVILLNESDNFSLAFLYNNGTVRGIANIGNFSSFPIFGALGYSGVYVTQVNPYEYYIIKTYSDPSTSTSNVSVKTEVIVYEITFPKPVVVTNTSTATLSSTISYTAPPSVPITLIAGIIVAVIIIVALVLILKRIK